jgi:multiple sugar transport system permease protein
MKVIRRVLFYLCLFAILSPFMFIFGWMLLSSLKSGVQQTAWPPLFLFKPTLDNYFTVFRTIPFLAYLRNSLVISLAATLLGLVLGLPAAYSIARWGQSRLALAILTSRMVPWISFLLPWYLLFGQLGLVDTHFALIITHLIITLPMTIWLMIPFFEELPIELEQAALIDGCTRLGAFLRIAVPLARPGIVASAVLGLIYSWNNFIFALILAGQKTQTLPIAVYQFVSYHDVNWGAITATATLMILPVLVLTLFIQRHLVRGLALGAVKF